MLLIALLVACEPPVTVIENHIEPSCCCDTDTDTDTDTGDPCAGFTAPTPEPVTALSECTAAPAPITFQPEIEWAWAPTDSAHPYNEVMSTPVAGNLTDDNGDGVVDTQDTPDVAFTAHRYPNYTDSPGALVIVSGDDGAELYYHTALTDPDGNVHSPRARGGVALGDIDSDGIPEACLPTDRTPLLCTHADGTVVLVGEAPDGSSGVDRDEWISSYPTIGDMDGDGDPEIAVGRMIWDNAGDLLAIGASSHGGYVHTNGVWYFSASVMSDLTGDGSLELVAGDVVYRRDGSILWSSADADNGHSAVGDLDLDGSPDVVTASAGTAYILDSAGGLSASFGLVDCSSGATCGPPTIADFDADGAPEIGIAGVTSYTVYDDEQTGTWTARWSAAISDGSGSTGAVVFDFEADGAAEVVFADENQLYIWRGADGVDLLNQSGWEHASGTGMESPALADIDNDGSTEILLGSNQLFSLGWVGVRAIGSGSGPSWAPSRPVWNQHAYHITNVEDDLSIPTSETPNWSRHNNFRVQDQGERPGSWQPDVYVADTDICADCEEGVVTVYAVVANQGWAGSGPVDVVLASGAGELQRTSVDLAPQESAVLGPWLVAASSWTGSVELTVDSGDDAEECDESNNTVDLGALPCD